MSGLVETLKTLNSFARTVVAAATVGLVGLAGWFGYSTYYAGDLALREKQQALVEAQADLAAAHEKAASAQKMLSTANAQLADSQQQVADQQARIARLNDDLAVKQREIEKLATAIKLLKVDHRVAELTVLEQGAEPDSGKMFSRVRFVEINDEGQPIDAPREFRLRGDIIFVDYWVVQFEDKYIEQADLERSTSICLFRRLFDEVGGPSNAHVLDEVGSRPTAYARGGKISDFEQKIWDDFWNIANNPDKAKQLGIRAAHGQASYTQVREGKTYRLLLRASGGLTITPAEEAENR